MPLLARSATEIVDSLFNYAVQEKLLTSSNFRRGRFGILFSVLSTEMAIWEQVLELMQQECFIETAVLDESIEKICAPFRYRFPAKNSNVRLYLFWNIPDEQKTEDVDFTFGQIVETSESNPIQYVIAEDRTLYREQEYITVKAISRLTGLDTYVKEQTLNRLNPGVNGVGVINYEESWGGVDQESYSDLRENAKMSRFALEKGTLGALRLSLQEYGLQPYNYNLVENLNGYGNFAIYIDTTLDELIKDIKITLNREKAAGIYMICDKATPLNLDLDFEIKIASSSDLLPNERDMLKKDLNQTLSDFILKNGVGQKIVVSRAIHYIYNQLIDKYDLYDLNLSLSNYTGELDEDGNIILENAEVAKIENINYEIITERG